MSAKKNCNARTRNDVKADQTYAYDMLKFCVVADIRWVYVSSDFNTHRQNLNHKCRWIKNALRRCSHQSQKADKPPLITSFDINKITD